MTTDFDEAFAAMPIIAILRGLTPLEAPDIADALVSSSIRIIEVPLNSPQPLESIKMLAERLAGRAIVGAGTVMTPQDVERIAAAGGRLIVSPHTDERVIKAAVASGLAVVPGALSPSECFRALEAGAHALKLFPSEMVPPPSVRALRAVLPKSARLINVGGIEPRGFDNYMRAGSDGFGLGGWLYRPGAPAHEVAARARLATETIVRLKAEGIAQ